MTSTLRRAGLLHDLPTILAGRAITSVDPEYDALRGSTATARGFRPSLIVRAADAIDVALVIELARSAELELAVRAGGHSMAGHSTTDGGILLDLADMREMGIDPIRHIGWADAGVTAGEFTRRAAAHGLAAGFGDTASVGIAGLTLGGGIGWLVRKHGLTIDNLVAVDLITADGSSPRVDAASDPELFWALRGGGGNFGVATRFAYRLSPIATVTGGLLVLPAIAEVLRDFVIAADAAPDDLTTVAHLSPTPPLPFIPADQHGRLALLATLVHAGDPARARREIDALRVAAPLADTIRPMAYPEVYGLAAASGHGGPAATRSTFVDALSLETATTIIGRMLEAPSPHSVMQIRVLGGAMARVPADATAFAHRKRFAMVTVASTPLESGDDRHQAWVDRFIADLPGSGRGVYVNFLGDEGPDRVREAYPDGAYERLVAVKRRYDPTNLFHRNPNIDPRPETTP